MIIYERSPQGKDMTRVHEQLEQTGLYSILIGALLIIVGAAHALKRTAEPGDGIACLTIGLVAIGVPIAISLVTDLLPQRR